MSDTSTTSKNRQSDYESRAFFVDSFLSQIHNSTHEQTFMTQTEQNLSTSKNEEEIRIDKSQTFPKWASINLDGIAIGTCTGVVHASPEEVLAYMYLTDTHQAQLNHIATTGPDSSKYPNKTIRVVNDHHKITYLCRKLHPPLNPREFLTRNIIQRVDANTLKYFYTAIHDDDPDLPPSFTKTTIANVVRGEISMIHEYERLPLNRTKLTLRLKLDIKGGVLKKIANMGMSGALGSVYKAYKYFQRDEEIDELEVSLLRCVALRCIAFRGAPKHYITPQLIHSLRLSLQSTTSAVVVHRQHSLNPRNINRREESDQPQLAICRHA